VLGGTGSPWGALVGAAVITLLPELLRGLGDYRPLINGVILMAVILYSPKAKISTPRSKPYSLGLMKKVKWALRPPASPASAAPRAKANNL
jgi:hypothetical protein